MAGIINKDETLNRDYIISKLINTINDSSAISKGHNEVIILDNNTFANIEITKEKASIIRFNNTTSNICFIDGGNSELLSAPNFSLQFIRAYACIFNNKNKKLKSKKIEFYSLVTCKGYRAYAEIIPQSRHNVLEFIDPNDLSISLSDKSLDDGIIKANISMVGDLCRRFAELSLACECANGLEKGDIIVLDGTLQSTMANEDKYLNKLFHAGMQKGISITSVSKTSRIITKSGKSINSLLRLIDTKNCWYFDAKTIINDSDLYFIKLNKKSDYIFRFEAYSKNKYDINSIASALANNSNDPIFIGYPYGLIMADKFARVTNKEAEYLRTLLELKAKDNWKIIKTHLNSINAHDILDRIG